MVIDLLLVAAGLTLLLVGGDFLVRGASAIARRFGVTPLIIGLTVVSFGTSAPELVVNLSGAYSGNTGLAFGNVVGSNLANLGLVLGIGAIVRSLAVESAIVVREIPMALLAVVALAILAADPVLRGEDAVIDRSDGLILLILFSVFLYYTARSVFVPGRDEPLREETADFGERRGLDRLWAASLVTVVGLVGLIIGGELTVRGGSALATSLGVSDVIVGFTVVAVGTSLPELVTTVVAALRGEVSLAVGNVVGSNLFNVLFILGTTATFRPIPVPEGGGIDVAAVIVITVLIIPFGLTDGRRILRREGIVLLLLYVGYVTWRTLG